MARQTITIRRVVRSKKKSSQKGTKRCPTCGKYMK